MINHSGVLTRLYCFLTQWLLRPSSLAPDRIGRFPCRSGNWLSGVSLACQRMTACVAFQSGTDFPATGGTVSYWGHGGHRELAFHVPEWRTHMPRCAWRCHMTNFSISSAGIPALYPVALKRSADGRRIAPDWLEHNQNMKVLHNFDGTVEKDSRPASKIRRAKVRASSARIKQEHRQAYVPGDGASSFWADVEKAGIKS